MNFKRLRIPLLIFVTIFAVITIIYVPKYQRAMAMAEAMEMENIDESFINMDQFLPVKRLTKSTKPFIFPKVENIDLPESFEYEGTTFSTQAYLDSSYTQGFLVIQNDTIVYENYWLGQAKDIEHISWSMAKSYISALFGIAMEEGFIESVHQKVDDYLPELKGSGYEGVTIKDVLQMSSGVRFDETYSDPNSDINRYWESFLLGGSQDAFAATLVNERPAGTLNHYVSINTHVLGMIIVKATGRSLTDYLQEKIWEPLGCEYSAYWLVDGEGMEMALGGFNACLRDYAKLGRLFLNKGNWNGQQIVPLAWFEVSTNAIEEHLLPDSKNSTDYGLGYGYQWWLLDGDAEEFMAIGVFNQYIYMNPSTGTVITKNSANKNYYDDSNPHSNSLVHAALFREIAKM